MNSMTLDLQPETFHSPSSSVLDFTSDQIYSLSSPSNERSRKPILNSVEELIEETNRSIDNSSESSPNLLSVSSNIDSYSNSHITLIPPPLQGDGTTHTLLQDEHDGEESNDIQSTNAPVSTQQQNEKEKMLLQQPLQQQTPQLPHVMPTIPITMDNNMILLPSPQMNYTGLQLTEEDLQQINQQLQQSLLPATTAAHPCVFLGPIGPNLPAQQFIVPAPPQGYCTSQGVMIPTLHPMTSVPSQSTPINTQDQTSQYPTLVNASKPTSTLTKVTPAVQYIKLHPKQSEDNIVDLDDLQKFAKYFKQRRVELGFTQGDVGLALGKCYPNDFSQTTISRFEASNLSPQNMRKLKPLLQRWLENQEHSGVIHLISNTFCERTSPEPASPDAKKRKKRTTIEDNIKDALEIRFQTNPKPNASELSKIANEHDIDREVVRVWFCNRRQREKRLPKVVQSVIVNSTSMYNYQPVVHASPATVPVSYSQTTVTLNSQGEADVNTKSNTNASVRKSTSAEKCTEDAESHAALSAAMASPQGAVLHGFVQPLVLKNTNICN